MFVWVSSSAFFSSDITQTFLFCLQRVAAARFLSRNFLRLSSGSSSTTLRRRPPVGWGGCIVWVGCICCVAGETCGTLPDLWNTASPGLLYKSIAHSEGSWGPLSCPFYRLQMGVVGTTLGALNKEEEVSREGLQ